MQLSFRRTARYVSVAALPLLFAAATPLADGWTYDFVMKSQSKATGNKEKITMSGRGVYAGDNARIEITEASAGTSDVFGSKGSYFVVKGGGKEMLLVSPKEKQYMKWDIANMFAGMSKVLNAVGGLVKMEISDVKIDATDLGAGEQVQGYPTRHIRMVQNFTVTAKVFGRSHISNNESTSDYYIAPSLRITNPFVANSQQMAMLSQFDMFKNPDYQRQVTTAMSKFPRGGIPLKTVTTTVSTDEKGKQETSMSTTEIINFKATNVPASTFEIPSDYKLVEMPDLSASLAADGNGGKGADSKGSSLNADSVAAAAKEGAKEGVKDAVKDQAKQATAKKLKGIFKR
jgi:hypothetical protein